jgi:hypothetical protein
MRPEASHCAAGLQRNSWLASSFGRAWYPRVMRNLCHMAWVAHREDESNRSARCRPRAPGNPAECRSLAADCVEGCNHRCQCVSHYRIVRVPARADTAERVQQPSSDNVVSRVSIAARDQQASSCELIVCCKMICSLYAQWQGAPTIHGCCNATLRLPVARPVSWQSGVYTLQAHAMRSKLTRSCYCSCVLHLVVSWLNENGDQALQATCTYSYLRASV